MHVRIQLSSQGPCGGHAGDGEWRRRRQMHRGWYVALFLKETRILTLFAA